MGFWFEEAKDIFSDPYHKVFLDSIQEEDRYIGIGFAGSERLLVVVFCYREKESALVSALSVIFPTLLSSTSISQP